MSDIAAGLPITLDDGTRKYVWGLGLAYAVTGDLSDTRSLRFFASPGQHLPLMRVPADLLFLTLAAMGFVGFRRTGRVAFVAVMAIGLGSIVLGVIGSRPQVIVRLGAGDAILLLTLFVVGAAVQGLPPGIARRIKFGFRSREWEFDRRFFQYKKHIDAALAAYPDPPTLEAYRAWKSRTIAVGDRVVKQMSKLKEPDEEWSSLRDDYVEAYTGILRRIAHDEEHDAAEIVRRGTELKERAEVLIRKYRIELDRSSRRRDEIRIVAHWAAWLL